MKAILITLNKDLYSGGLSISKDVEILDIVEPGIEAENSIKLHQPEIVLLDQESALKLNNKFIGDTEEEYVYSSTRMGIKKILIDDIVYFAAEDKYVTACLPNQELLINTTLQYLEEKYKSKLLRIHRKYLVALKEFKELVKDDEGKYYLLLNSSKEKLPVSRRKLPIIRKQFREG